MLQDRCRQFISALLLPLLPALLLLGCVTTTDLPPVSSEPSGAQLPGKIISHDLLTRDADAARRFYSGLFGWSFDDIATDIGNFIRISNRGTPIGNLIGARSISGSTNVSRWIPVLSVTDLDRAVQLTESDRGTVYQSPIAVEDRGRIAVIGDPLGAVLSLISPIGSVPRDQAPRAGDWVWDELWTDYPQQTSAFYLALVANYGIRISDGDGREARRLLTSQGKPRAGILAKPVAGIPHTWLGYIRVADPEDLAAKVPALGGRVLMPPRENPSGGSVAMFSDPTGAAFLVQSWPAEG